MNTNLIFLLSRLKYLSKLRKTSITTPQTKLNLSALSLLYKYGVVQNFYFIDYQKSRFGWKHKIRLHLRYFYTKAIGRRLNVISIPSRQQTILYWEICCLYNRRHTLFVSTNKGLLNNLECKIVQTGGIAVFKC